MINTENIYALLKKYSYIKELHFSREIQYDEYSDFDLELKLAEYPCYNSDDVLSLKFIGVRDLQLNDLEYMFKIVLEITPIFEMQLENLNYTVKETENDVISFKCKNIIL